jgi:hypothetical protein
MGTYDQDEPGKLKAYTRFDIQIDPQRLEQEAFDRTESFFKRIRNNEYGDVHNYQVYDCNQDLGHEYHTKARASKAKKEAERHAITEAALESYRKQASTDLTNLNDMEKTLNSKVMEAEKQKLQKLSQLSLAQMERTEIHLMSNIKKCYKVAYKADITASASQVTHTY